MNQCVNVAGEPVCKLQPILCNNSTNCTTGKCKVVDNVGKCFYDEVNCGTSDKCVNFYCNEKTGGCQKTLKCEDNNPCTIDTCDINTGTCKHENKVCNTTDPCKKALCDPNIGCVEQPLDCAKDRNLTIPDTCHYAVCVNNTGCQVAIIPNTLDACGFCNMPGKCKISRGSKVPSGAIAGAIIGGAVIAGIAAIGIGMYASSRAASSFLAGGNNAIMGGNNNPLYETSEHSGENPMDNSVDDYLPMNN